MTPDERARLARSMGLDPQRYEAFRILRTKHDPETALRLAAKLGGSTSPVSELPLALRGSPLFATSTNAAAHGAMIDGLSRSIGTIDQAERDLFDVDRPAWEAMILSRSGRPLTAAQAEDLKRAQHVIAATEQR